MLHIYDLYDLHSIFINIRFCPEHETNSQILEKTIGVLEDRYNNHEVNQFRTALRSIDSLDKELYTFAFVENIYTYFPAIIKNESIYLALRESCKYLLKAVQEKNKEKIIDLADCLHDLPIIIAENHFSIPKSYWKIYIDPYRKKWDKDFMKLLQKKL